MAKYRPFLRSMTGTRKGRVPDLDQAERISRQRKRDGHDGKPKSTCRGHVEKIIGYLNKN